MSSGIVFIDVYSCPHCRAELETGFSAWQGWQRCPACGLPSLPPEPSELLSHRRYPLGPGLTDDVFVIADTPENASGADPVGQVVDRRSSHISPARLVFRTGLLVSLGLAFIFFLDRGTSNMMIFLTLSAIFFVLLIRNSGKRPANS
jgi:hypothetical protein